MTNSQNDDLLLEDLLSGQDRLLTSGEVADILNINANTLYLWRTSTEVNLPFQRFVAPGQTRGMIRYRYSDVANFIAQARERGEQDRVQQQETGTQRLELIVEASDAEELEEYNARLKRAQDAAARKKQKHSRKKKDALREITLEDALVNSGLKYSPEFVADASTTVVDLKAKAFIEELYKEMHDGKS
jgi:hypothetical protein